ncbi:hypothetical protein MP477_20815 [Chryseobacterium sp. WG23]|uniref:hypothetical protein n=1 Tax=Chryseobacterium sp. WG23 TaxID=2926910 RepID=UPI00211DDA65|nr:hypothetical protein [Chryseobacterium sp. WG23]MCQ9637399.1 hypothetical protein [Chryseobacterium sp. WG23]
MKNIIINCSMVIALFVSCSPATEKKGAEKADSTEVKVTTVPTSVPVKDTISQQDMPSDFSALVPIDVLNSKSTNVHEKYGIEFSGNCYSCDLASLSVTKNKMIWTNICDENDTFKIDGFSFSNEGNKTVLKTPERTYTIMQIDKAPVYELVIEGKKLELNNKRVSRYFTTKKALPLFKEHDCGDFEG